MTRATKKRATPQKFTPARIAKLLTPSAADGDYPDARTPGLSLRVRTSKTGKAGTWRFTYRAEGKQHRLTIAKAAGADFGLENARAIAAGWRNRIDSDKAAAAAAIATGSDAAPVFNPAIASILGGNAPQVRDVKGALGEYYTERLEPVTPQLPPAEVTRRNKINKTRIYLTELLPMRVQPSWADLPMTELTALRSSSIKQRRQQLKAAGVGPVSINRGTQYFSAFLGWSVQQGYLDRNPMLGFSPDKADREKTRDVIPTPAELRALWQALDDPSISPDYLRIWRLLVLTGCRRGEVATATADQLQGDLLRITQAKTDAGNRVVPLSATAQHTFAEALQDKGAAGPYIFAMTTEGRTPFGNWSKSVKLQHQLAGIDRHITIHDLRRLAYTRLSGLGVDLTVLRTLIGHQLGDANQRTYNQNAYLTEMRAAVAALEASILGDVA